MVTDRDLFDDEDIVQGISCISDEECGFGYRCTNGACHKKMEFHLEQGVCKSNGDCSGSKRCIRSKCVNPSMVTDPSDLFDEEEEPVKGLMCANDANCGPGYVCIRGACAYAREFKLEQGTCKSAGDCSGSKRCIRGKCVNPSMVEDRDLFDESEPVQGLMCVSAGNCGPNEYCRNHVCVPYSQTFKLEQGTCKSAGDCSGSKRCIRGKCVNPSMVTDPSDLFEDLPTACSKPADCGSDERCQQGYCIKPQFAAVQGAGVVCGKMTCTPGQKCLRGKCAYPSVELLE